MNDLRLRSPLRHLLAAPLLLVSLAPTAIAQELEYVPEVIPPVLEDEEANLWDYGLQLGASLAFGDNRSVVGQQDGYTIAGTLSVNGHLRLRQNAHEWNTTLSTNQGVTRTPAVERFVKNADTLVLDSTYYYLIIPSPAVGPFARINVETPVFANADVRGERVDYRINRLDGSVDEVDGRLVLRLTDAFNPLLLKQSAGFFARPLQRPDATLSFRAGFGTRQTFADNQFAVSDDDSTPEIEVKELESYMQAGSELSLQFTGELEDQGVTYTFSAEAMTPFIDDTLGEDISPLDLTNYDIAATLSFRLTSWASLDYRFSARKLPRLVDDWQLINNLLLTFSYRILG
jgi:hypothetical protein